MKILVKMMLTVCSGTLEAMLPRKFINLYYSPKQSVKDRAYTNTSIILL